MKRNKFSLSHYKLLTCDMGELVPLTWFEVLPGDSVQQATACLIRLSPLLSPVMHPVRVRIHHWFVPNRLLWEDWEDFITGGEDGLDASEWPHFHISGSVSQSTLQEYMGLPAGSYAGNHLDVSALPFRAYNLIYNEAYRDQDLCSELAVSLASGVDATTATTTQKVAWEKDYFTSARLTEQKGTEVTIPIGDEAPVIGIGKAGTSYGGSSGTAYESDGGTATYANYARYSATSHDDTLMVEKDGATNYPHIRADLSQSTGVNINDFRLALALQRYQEERNRYGARYVEYLRSLGVRSSDSRLQSPEYLGGGRQVIQFSEVLQSAEGTNPVGTMRGHGIGAVRSNRYRKFFDEHGLIMTLMSVVPKAIYRDTLHRKWLRETKEDYFQKELQFLGDQVVLNKEAYAFHSTPAGTFGFQGRYDDYRYLPSTIAGEFSDSHLYHWHLARIHAGDVALNQSFTDCTPSKRVFADSGHNTLYVMANHSVQARRMLIRRPSPRTF